jgi:hypothetical protein
MATAAVENADALIAALNEEAEARIYLGDVEL